MHSSRPFCQKTLLLAAAALQAGAQQAAYTPADAVRAEWDRRPPVVDAAALPAADRARLELSLRRIGAPGAPPLLPPWLDKPEAAAWEARALEARTPEERVTALHFLNRLKSPRALSALESLTPQDAASWPAALHLELPVATARVNGSVPGPGAAAFLEALRKAGKSDPVRAGAAKLRLVMAGIEKGEARLSDPNSLWSLDAWNKGPWDMRAKEHLALLAGALASPFSPGPAQRLIEGLPLQADPAFPALERKALASDHILVRLAVLDRLARLPALAPEVLAAVKEASQRTLAGPLCGPTLAVLRRHAPAEADRYARMILNVDDPLALAALVEDMPAPPQDLEPLLKRLWTPAQYDAVQAFLPALDRWKLPEEKRKAILRRFLDHPCWTARLDAWNLLAKLDPSTPWPRAPKPTFSEELLLAEAQRLARQGRPVRAAITFEGARKVVLRLDPSNAPINVANFVLLARKGWFDDHLVPRVVPDFVVQMGSPVDTMDGGPGYTVRCEDSLAWYGPGSVGMALSGKDTGGSQIFITTNATPHLTGRYTRIGEVEDPADALKILDALELGTRIVSVRILEGGTYQP
ncbi:MAG TPA: peptidylprolyl isomerase [Holophaga sp.]|nr:peptidylprolyl isomerase [Holophaga sp.]